MLIQSVQNLCFFDVNVHTHGVVGSAARLPSPPLPPELLVSSFPLIADE